MANLLIVKLGNVQKTLFLPLWGRSVGSKKQIHYYLMKLWSRVSNRWIMTFRKWNRISTN